MSFLAPLFFVALAAVAVPVFVHLIQRERKDIVEFPSLMFIQKIPYQSVERRRIHNWPLLLMRIAAMALVVAAFSRPFFATQIYVERNAGRVRVCNEDYLFCAKLRGAGYRVMLHPEVRCAHYDRSKAHAFPERWEDPQMTNRKRVLARIGERYALIPLEEAPKTVARERQIAADVTYIESDEID